MGKNPAYDHRASRRPAIASIAPLLALAILAPMPAAAQPGFGTLAKFYGQDGCDRGADGLDRGKLTFDAQGAAYGTTLFGGSEGGGTIFRLRPGSHQVAVLFSFGMQDSGFVEPNAGLVFDAAGGLWGTTIAGGTAGSGSLFRFDPETGEAQDIYSFHGERDGERPNGALVRGPDGVLYGTTQAGGAQGGGTIFRLDTHTGAERVLYAFGGGERAGRLPLSGLKADAAGRLIGTLNEGGAQAGGQIYRFDPATSELAVLHEFRPRFGAAPIGGLTMDGAGNVYGVTQFGGAANAGVVFRLDTGSQDYLVLHGFAGGPTDGAEPRSVAFDGHSALYGVTARGGSLGYGTLFRLALSSPGYAVLANLSGLHAGGEPADQPAFHAGRLYGMTTIGGARPRYHGCGTVFRYTP